MTQTKGQGMRLRSTVIRSFAVALTTFTLLAGIVGYSGSATASDNLIAEIKERGKLRVGFSSFVPWAFLNSKGEYVGFEIDVARRLASDMEVELELVPTAWDGIIPALLVGKFDLIIGGMSVTPQRNLKINFTTIAYNPVTGYDLVARKDSVQDGMSIDEMNASGLTAGLRRGSSAVDVARNYFPDAVIRQYDDEAIITRELITGGVDFFVAAAPLPATLEKENPDKLFRPFDEYLAADPVGIGLRKGDPDALNYLNNWTRSSLADGFLGERAKYWFESNAWKEATE